MNLNKNKKLQELRTEVENLTISPLYYYRLENNYQPVIGEGPLEARIMLVGEAPGKEEAKTGRPFVGAAGKKLDKLLRNSGINRKDVYITSVVKDRPPGNRTPNKQEIAVYGPLLIGQIEIIQPEVIVCMGKIATRYLFQHFQIPLPKQNLNVLRRKFFSVRKKWGEIRLLATYHPAAVFYNRKLFEIIEKDFLKIRYLNLANTPL